MTSRSVGGDLLIGLVGCGAIAKKHAAAYANVGGVRIVAVTDVSRQAAEEMASRTGARACTSAEEMVRKSKYGLASAPTTSSGP